MSVAGSPTDSILIPRHYGSGYAMADYQSNVHNVYVAASFLASPRLRISSTVAYNVADAGYDEILMPEDEIRARLVNSAHPDGDLHEQDFNFEDVITYSDFDYTLLRLTLGLEYQVTPRVTVTADGEFADLTDESNGYVYGDESGQLFMIRSGVRMSF